MQVTLVYISRIRLLLSSPSLSAGKMPVLRKSESGRHKGIFTATLVWRCLITVTRTHPLVIWLFTEISIAETSMIVVGYYSREMQTTLLAMPVRMRRSMSCLSAMLASGVRYLPRCFRRLSACRPQLAKTKASGRLHGSSFIHVCY